MSSPSMRKAVDGFKKGKFVIGELYNQPALEYTERYKHLNNIFRL